MRLFNRKTIVKFSIALSLLFIVGCSSQNKTSNNSVNKNKNQANKVNSNGSSSNYALKNNVPESSEKQKNQNNALQNELLESIKKFAVQGKIINCEYPVKTTNVYSVEEKWGKADSSNWVTSAKGMYSTYLKHSVIFGSNKGAQVFEVRSLDSKLNKISLSMVKEKFGVPEHKVLANGEEIIGYVVSKEFKILFVFPKPTKNVPNPFMRHYSVLYPAATVNSMANDSGRQW
ncbi:YjgB family protein [Clostridium guangxiense]|uniref:YjgB family protein n=1 Tax=Clostridium guangxiense TaxID=1662055 RepID=UPI001E40AB29|nr:YjgB family protein [Clostridium guangxiense]MCD2346109.1 YjgB family protein [Clostridium guangxiense]